jgi:hypothetical protein
MSSDPRSFSVLFGGTRVNLTRDEIELEISMSLSEEDLKEVFGAG